MKSLSILAIAFFTIVSAANALTFDLAWSGAEFGNNATATGSITVDETLFTSANNDGSFLSGTNWVTDFEITVSGSNSGNGTFTLADYDGFIWQTLSSLDLSQELVGQDVTNGIDTLQWGDINLPGATGDFNIISNGTAPAANFFFRITTVGGTGENLYLTSFKRVPDEEASVLGLLGIGLAMLGSFARRKKA